MIQQNRDPSPLLDDHDMLKGVVESISGSLDSSEALRAMFDFLSRHFPLTGLTMHNFSFDEKAFRVLFVVTEQEYFFLDEQIPLPGNLCHRIAQNEKQRTLVNTPNCNEDPVASRHCKALSKYIPIQDRAYLVAFLSVESSVLGHLCLVGNSTDCFTAEHQHKLNLVLPAINMAMRHLLQYHQALELQKKIESQRQVLAGEVELLKHTNIIGEHGDLQEVMQMVRQLTGSEMPVLIQGETGTGKELFADAVQKISPRLHGPYIKVNCGAIPESLVDSELFGYRKGAFTGATSDRIGRFEQADGGTLFLDELGDLPPMVQVRLLRVLQNGTIERLGCNTPIPVDVRIIAATNKPLEIMLQEGTFREDLYYRLNAFPLHIPPLRERRQDLPLLIYNFAETTAKKHNLPCVPQITADSLEKLKEYSWPGNVRELENLVERAITIAPEGPLELDRFLPKDPSCFVPSRWDNNYFKSLLTEHVEEILSTRMEIGTNCTCNGVEGEKTGSLKPLDEAMAEHIQLALEHCKGKISGKGGAAELLKINPNTLRKRMDKLNVSYGFKR